jgi:hypothetical protein
VVRVVLGLICFLALTGCGVDRISQDYADARDVALYGVPVHMDLTGAIERISRQNLYFMTLAGLPVGKQPADQTGQLWPVLPSDLDWPSITARGMSDIDAVCANYFRRLDDFADYRRSIRDGTGIIGSATTTLMAALDAAQGGIAIVSSLFGVTQALMDTGSQAALFSVDPTRLYNLHAKAASAYRQHRQPPIEQISSPGQAADMLGGYVTLCTPVALKGLISETVERVEIGSTEDGRVGVSGAKPSLVLERLQVDQPIPATPVPHGPQRINGARSDLERLLSRPQGETIQSALCVPADGDFGMDTRSGIVLYRRHLGMQGDDPQLNAPLTLKEATDLLAAGPCAGERGYKNAWERFQFGTGPSVRALQVELDRLLDDRTVRQSGQFDAETRAAIASLNRRFGLPAGDEVTPALSDKIAI